MRLCVLFLLCLVTSDVFEGVASAAHIGSLVHDPQVASSFDSTTAPISNLLHLSGISDADKKIMLVVAASTLGVAATILGVVAYYAYKNDVDRRKEDLNATMNSATDIVVRQVQMPTILAHEDATNTVDGGFEPIKFNYRIPIFMKEQKAVSSKMLRVYFWQIRAGIIAGVLGFVAKLFWDACGLPVNWSFAASILYASVMGFLLMCGSLGLTFQTNVNNAGIFKTDWPLVLMSVLSFSLCTALDAFFQAGMYVVLNSQGGLGGNVAILIAMILSKAYSGSLITYYALLPISKESGRVYIGLTVFVLCIVGALMHIFLTLPLYNAPSPWFETSDSALRGVLIAVSLLPLVAVIIWAVRKSHARVLSRLHRAHDKYQRQAGDFQRDRAHMATTHVDEVDID